MRKIAFWGSVALFYTQIFAQNYADFENIVLPERGYANGDDRTTSFQDGGLVFPVQFNTQWNFWSGGFALSNKTDKTTSGFTNLYSASTGIGVFNSNQYAVGQNNAVIRTTNKQALSGLYVTNTTYALKSMENGDNFAKKFGGETGTDPDWFLLTVLGYENGAVKTDTVKFYLADFRFDEPTMDYIVKTWRWLDLSKLGDVDSVQFKLSSSDVGSAGMNTPAFFAIDNVNQPLFAPKAGVEGSTAVFRDDVSIKSWATKATITRGPQNISLLDSPLASVGTESNVLGKANGQVLSLGDGGSVVLEFAKPIRNGAGFDFAVFENGFSFNNLEFLELAFVEVSTDGERYVRFPAVSITDPVTQVGSFGAIDARYIHNLAGKYIANQGTPFDLEELKDSIGIDIENINYVRLVDVVGSINPMFATFDRNGNPVNDPWPTDFASSGFDLDAVGVLNENITSFNDLTVSAFGAFPNPFEHIIKFSKACTAVVHDLIGNKVFESQHQISEIETEDWKPGIYFVKTENGNFKLKKN
ncbi:MAG: DUF4465 domain-containing protein [Cytophagales bacterium]